MKITKDKNDFRSRTGISIIDHKQQTTSVFIMHVSMHIARNKYEGMLMQKRLFL